MRVVEGDREVPSRATAGFRGRSGHHDPRLSPEIHVEWVLPGATPAGASRVFMVYFDTRANGAKTPAEHDERAAAPLAARHWISRGTTLFGAASTVRLLGLEDGTRATVSAYVGARPVGLGTFDVEAGSVRSVNVGNEAALVRIDADKPIIAYGADPVKGVMGPVPSAEGGLLGRTFAFEPGSTGHLVLAPRETANVVEGSSRYAVHGGRVQVVPAGGSAAIANLEADAPVLVFAWPADEGKTQLPSVDGAPVGSRLVGFAGPGTAPASLARDPRCHADGMTVGFGEVLVTARDAPTWFRGRDFLSGNLVLPTDGTGQPSTRSEEAAPGEPARAVVRATRCPVLVHATGSRTADAVASGTLAAFGGPSRPLGAQERLRTPLGGDGGMTFETSWPVDVLAFHPATTVTIERAGTAPAKVGLGAGDRHGIEASHDRPAILRATKPVAVVPVEQGYYFAGIDDSLGRTAIVGPAQYRGHLVNLAPAAEAAEPLVGLAGPGIPATFRLVVTNLARDHRGAPVQDTVRLATPPAPEGWRVALSRSVVTLAGGESREIVVTVTPPEDAREGARLALSVAATSASNSLVEDRVPLVTLVRATFGVDLWFDREHGPRSRVFTFDAGDERRATVAIRNLATVRDTITVVARAISSDWTSLLGSGTSSLSLDLEAGEVREIPLVIRAPAENATQSVLEIVAVSRSDASATAKIAGIVRIRPDVRIALEVASQTLEIPPGASADFRVTLTNRGGDAIGASFNVTAARPPGWRAPVIRFGAYEIDELSGIPPQKSVTFNVTVAVPETAARTDRAELRFTARTIPTFVGDPVSSEAIDLLALAGVRRDLEIVDAPTLVAVDADNRASIVFEVENRGNGNESLRIVPRRLPAGATALVQSAATVPRDGSARIGLDVALAATTDPGVHAIGVHLAVDGGAAIAASVNLSVPRRPALAFEALGQPIVLAGRVSALEVDVHNTGNVPLALPPAFEERPGWNVTWDAPASILPVGGVARGRILVAAPAGVEGPASLPLSARTGSGALAVDVRTVSLEVVEAEPDGATIVVVVRNSGSADAHAVAIEFVRDGTLVDRLVLQRIAAGGEARAILAAPGEGRLRVDADGRFHDVPIEVAAGGTARPVPAVGLAAVVAATLLAGRMRRFSHMPSNADISWHDHALPPLREAKP
ncbi:MAG TPA: NEW3 domain-containing protein [Candidatus Thermoplasmatota archaeon]|nr:NEW3 domain-containing protein [Candidatus Thermoplasmatota archaeon]